MNNEIYIEKIEDSQLGEEIRNYVTVIEQLSNTTLYPLLGEMYKTVDQDIVDTFSSNRKNALGKIHSEVRKVIHNFILSEKTAKKNTEEDNYQTNKYEFSSLYRALGIVKRMK